MLEVLANFINCTITAILGFYIIKRIIKSDVMIYEKRSFLLLMIESLIITYIQQIDYIGLHTLFTLIINIIIYKEIFKMNFNESIIVNVLLILLLFICDIIIVSILHPLFTVANIRSDWLIYIIVNFSICLLSVIVFSNKKIKHQLQKFYKNINLKIRASNVLYSILLIMLICMLVYSLYKNIGLNNEYIMNISIIIVTIILTVLFINSKNDYIDLSNEYDALFTHIQTFEDWIEREQLNRHEYKNQLAVLHCLTKEKKVKDKIDEILEDNINIEDQAVTQLKGLPKGGIKGLMYYKAAIAQKNKINLTTDVSIENKGILTKLSEKEVKVLCKLIGIYFDNAIEAAAESRKKNVTIEIYELKDKVSIVFSNTFKKHKNMKDRNEKGVSSKGEGRGNGLYFASKLIKENDWLEQKQDIVDRYYIQELIIRKSHSK